MGLVSWQATVQDEFGNVVPSPVVTVRNAAGGSLAAIYDMSGVLIGNPITGSLNGFVQFQVNPGRYRIEGAKDGSLTDVWEVDASVGGYFATRAAAVTNIAAGWVPTVGAVYEIAGRRYVGTSGSTDISDMPGLSVVNPAIVADDDDFAAVLNGSILTGSRNIAAPNGDGTLSLVSDVSGIVTSMISGLPRETVGTFTPDFKFTDQGDTTWTGTKTGLYTTVGSIVVWAVYMTTTLVPGANPAPGGQSLLLDMSDLGDTGAGPLLPANRLNMGMVTYKGPATNVNNVRLAVPPGETDWRIYYDDPSTPTVATQQVTRADLDTVAGSLFWAVGFFVK